MTDIAAIAKYVRVSPRKLQLVADGVRMMTPERAVTQLNFLQKSGAVELKKVILSALANARLQNFDPATLKIKFLNILPGTAMKRFRAVSRGMAHTYKKRMSHISVVLTTSDKTQTVILQKNSVKQQENIKNKK